MPYKSEKLSDDSREEKGSEVSSSAKKEGSSFDTTCNRIVDEYELHECETIDNTGMNKSIGMFI